MNFCYCVCTVYGLIQLFIQKIIHVNQQIGNGVFLAAGSIIMGNIIVGDGAVIDAGSVVTKPVRPYTRVGGVPGREISVITSNDDSILDGKSAFM